MDKICYDQQNSIYIYGILKELTNTLIQTESLEGTRIKNKFVGIRDLSLAGSC